MIEGARRVRQPARASVSRHAMSDACESGLTLRFARLRFVVLRLVALDLRGGGDVAAT
jgi:hypothetical protein